MLYRVDLPNDPDSAALLKRCLQSLALRFNDDLVTVDEAVFNAVRIWKLYGTTACKGDNTAERPHRQAKLLRVPDEIGVVSLDKLVALAGTVPTPPRQSYSTGERFDIDRWIVGHGIDVIGPLDCSLGRKWIFNICPWNDGHHNRSAFILQLTNGALSAGCHHNGCLGNDWSSLREMYEPGYRERRAGSAAGHSGGQAPDDGADHHVNQPVPDPDMLYGLAGKVGRTAAETTEVNEYAAAADFLAFLSAMVGRDVYLPVGNTWHHARLFTLHAGRTARGRKGDALSIVHRIRHEIQRTDETLLGQTHIGGLSTREGLALLIHDGYVVGKREIPPIDDKRLWVVESEFSNVLHQGKRDGNTLSSALRDAWDGVSIRPAIKSAPVWASDPHIALSGGITPSELLSVIERRELTNGFASRLLIFWAERKRLVDSPTATPIEAIKALADLTAKVILFARGDYPMVKDSRPMALGNDAKVLYKKLYRGELNRYGDGEILTALLERRAPMLLRLAMLFALTDLTLVISVNHINAALAWVRYWGDSVRFVFSGMADTEGAAERGELGEQIIEFLKKHGEADRTAIHRECFGAHVSGAKIDGALDDLLAETPPQIEMALVPRPDSQPGRGRKVYRFLIDTCAHSAHSAVRRPIMVFEDSGAAHNCAHSALSSDATDLTAQTAQLSAHGETQAQRLTAQHAQTAHTSIKNAEGISATHEDNPAPQHADNDPVVRVEVEP